MTELLIWNQKTGVSLEDMAMTRLDIEEEFGACPALDDILNGLKAGKEEKKGKPDKDAPKLNKTQHLAIGELEAAIGAVA